MNRRTFTFWLSFGLFALAERLQIDGLDELAAAALGDGKPAAKPRPTHWRLTDNGVWRWYERETFVDGRWRLSGVTTPVKMETGEAAPAQDGYLDESLVPAEVRRNKPTLKSEAAPAAGDSRSYMPSIETVGATTSTGGEALAADFADRRPSPKRRARHGRPPSKWLRSLQADELRIWLKTVDVPEADVVGMTFWEHLTRDHSFDPVKIEGLTLDEQAKLHAAAHYGY